MTDYTKNFYYDQMDKSYQSACIVLPLLFTRFRPASVVDIGCGVGTWLAVCRELGINRTLGIDGDYVPRNALKIPTSDFLALDLNYPLNISDRFDLAMSLEVAEHLPPERAEDFVSDLCSLSNVVLFSAAIPFQGGTGHLNENWPEYWAALFRARGFRVIDFIRPLVWTNNNVDVWYRQNLFVFVKEDTSDASHFIKFPDSGFLSIVHPSLYIYACRRRPGTGAVTTLARDNLHLNILFSIWKNGDTPDAKEQPGYGMEYAVNFKLRNMIMRSIIWFLKKLFRWKF